MKTILSNKICTAIDVGNLDSSGGKVFLKELTAATGTEISLSILPPKEKIPFFHAHIKNEETYIIIKGGGYFQVDDDCFEVKEGSVIRVSPSGKRGMYNSSSEPMIYIVVQSRENSLEEYTLADAKIVACEPKW